MLRLGDLQLLLFALESLAFLGQGVFGFGWTACLTCNLFACLVLLGFGGSGSLSAWMARLRFLHWLGSLLGVGSLWAWMSVCWPWRVQVLGSGVNGFEWIGSCPSSFLLALVSLGVVV